MLKTNSRQVKETIADYVVRSVLDYVVEQHGYIKENPIENGFSKGVSEKIKEVYDLFQNISDKSEKTLQKACCELALKVCETEIGGTSFKDFERWMAGINAVIDCDYYLCKGKQLLKEWLDETDAEADKYGECEAQDLITKLIYREVTRLA